jgi:hypothetical protein
MSHQLVLGFVETLRHVATLKDFLVERFSV